MLLPARLTAVRSEIAELPGRLDRWVAEMNARRDPLVKMLTALDVDFAVARRLVDEDRAWASEVIEVLLEQQAERCR